MRDLFIAQDALSKKRHAGRLSELDLLISIDLKKYAEGVKDQDRLLALEEVMDCYDNLRAVKKQVINLVLSDREEEAIAILNGDYLKLSKNFDDKLTYQVELERSFLQNEANLNIKETENGLNLFLIFVVMGLIPAVGFTIGIPEKFTKYLTNGLGNIKQSYWRINRRRAIVHKIRVSMKQAKESLQENSCNPELKLVVSKQGLEPKGRLLLFKGPCRHLWELRKLAAIVADLAEQVNILISTISLKTDKEKLDYLAKEITSLSREATFANKKIKILIKKGENIIKNLNNHVVCLCSFLQKDGSIEQEGLIREKNCLKDISALHCLTATLLLGLRELMELFDELLAFIKDVALTTEEAVKGIRGVKDDTEKIAVILKDMDCLARVQKKLAEQLSLLCYIFQSDISSKNY